MQQSPAQRASNARDADISAKAAEAPSWIKEQNMCPNFTFTIHGLASFSLPAYSVFACIGLLFMMLFLYAKTQQIGVSFLRFLLLVGAMAAGVGIGSKVLFALTQIPEFLKEPTLRNLGEIIWTSGFVFYGGLFGAILAVKLYAKVFRLNGQTFLDQIAPAFLLFHFWGRIGCFFAGFNVIKAAYLSAVGISAPANLISILRGFAVIIPAALAMSALWGVDGLWLSFAASEFIVSIVSLCINPDRTRKAPSERP